MGKSKKQLSLWKRLVVSLSLSMGVYLLCQVGITAMIMNGYLGEEGIHSWLLGVAALSVCAGGIWFAAGFPWGKLPGGLAFSVCFAALSSAVGAAFWNGITWSGQGGILFAVMIFSGIAAGLLARGKKRRRRRKNFAL